MPLMTITFLRITMLPGRLRNKQKALDPLRKALPPGVVPRAANRKSIGLPVAVIPLLRCHGNAVTEGVYAIDTIKAIVR